MYLTIQPCSWPDFIGRGDEPGVNVLPTPQRLPSPNKVLPAPRRLLLPKKIEPMLPMEASNKIDRALQRRSTQVPRVPGLPVGDNRSHTNTTKQCILGWRVHKIMQGAVTAQKT